MPSALSFYIHRRTKSIFVYNLTILHVFFACQYKFLPNLEIFYFQVGFVIPKMSMRNNIFTCMTGWQLNYEIYYW